MQDDSQLEPGSPADGAAAVEVKPVGEQYSLLEYFDDLKAVLMSPRRFTAEKAGGGSLAKPFVFVASCSMIGAIGYGLVHQLYMAIPNFFLTCMLENYLIGFLFHWLFKLFGGKAPLRDSLRACNYSIAPSVVLGVPILGTVAAVYSAVILFFGMRTVHQMSSVKAALLVGIPIVTCTVAGYFLLPLISSHHI